MFRALALAVLVAFSACGRDEEPMIGEVPASSDLIDRITRSADGGSVHLVRILHRPGRYRFEPDRIAIVTGDVVRFVMAGSLPESIVFDPGAASPEAATFIRDESMHLGVLLVEPGQSHDVSFRDAPPGSYPFYSIPHAERGMAGIVDVVGPRVD